MKKIICESTYFYGSSQQTTNTFRIMLRFVDPIEETVLRRALTQTVRRYPYYMVRCISDDRLRIRQKDLMQYCREQDGTPGVVTSLLLARAVDSVNPGNTKPIVTGMAMNLRPALEAPDYMGSPIGITYLSYDGKLKEKPFTT